MKHGVSQSSPWIIPFVLSVLLNIYFLVRVCVKYKDKKAKKARNFFRRSYESQNGSVNSPEPTRNIESVESVPNDQELKECDVESVGKNATTKNGEDEI